MSKSSTISLQTRNPSRKQSAFHIARFLMPMTVFSIVVGSIQITIRFTSASCSGLEEYPEMGRSIRNSRHFWARWAYDLNLVWKEMMRKRSRGTTEALPLRGMSPGDWRMFLAGGQGVLHLVPCMTLATRMLKEMVEGPGPTPRCHGRRQVFPLCEMELFRRGRPLVRPIEAGRMTTSNHIRGGRPQGAG